ncbi:hypothetical protein ACNOYE_23405 [Nannocystaceae bacterium ST9]
MKSASWLLASLGVLGAALMFADAGSATSPARAPMSAIESASKSATKSILVMPGPGKGPRAADRLDRNDDCVACHADVASEWSHSLHRQSFDDPMVQVALDREHAPGFCRSCHAPEADPRHEPSKRAAAAGVACVTCHLTGSSDEVLASPKSGVDDRLVPHALRREAAFASADACGGCHEFWFPSDGRVGHELKMQRTLAEHERSAFADESCQDCHMVPMRSGGRVHRGHRFTVAGEPATLRAAVTIDASRPEPGRVVLSLSPRLVGHAFPTGDLFRRIAVEVHAAGEGPAWSDQRLLARHFAGQRVGAGQVIKIERDDDRIGIGSGPRVVEFELPAELHDRAIRWSLHHEQVLEASIGAEHRAEVWDRTEFASGTLSPAQPAGSR